VIVSEESRPFTTYSVRSFANCATENGDPGGASNATPGSITSRFEGAGRMNVTQHSADAPSRHYAPEPRQDSPIYGCPRLKDVVVAAALRGEISEQDAADLFIEYGLRGV
jgi:hypothetical protein